MINEESIFIASSYTAFLCHYAEIAEETGCEMFCVGCEMLGTEHKVDYWRKAIEEVRKVYHGPITYNTNHGKEFGVKWWDAVDYIGTSAYYGVGKVPGDTMENMKAVWDEKKEKLAELSRLNGGKQIIFMEIGCRSASGCAMMPYDFSHREFPYDEDEQANFYESAMAAMWNEPWFAGFFWWDWYTRLPQRQPEMGFSIVGKKTEKVGQEKDLIRLFKSFGSELLLCRKLKNGIEFKVLNTRDLVKSRKRHKLREILTDASCTKVAVAVRIANELALFVNQTVVNAPGVDTDALRAH